MVIVNFIRDREVGMFARAKRVGKGIKKEDVDKSS
jgi:sphingolipid 4-desaturase/C4-monooxygenase